MIGPQLIQSLPHGALFQVIQNANGRVRLPVVHPFPVQGMGWAAANAPVVVEQGVAGHTEYKTAKRYSLLAIFSQRLPYPQKHIFCQIFCVQAAIQVGIQVAKYGWSIYFVQLPERIGIAPLRFLNELVLARWRKIRHTTTLRNV